jgi:hypothetical protein
MHLGLQRAAIALMGAMTAAAASAEVYNPLIYRVPNGYAWMQVEGAGDNGVMSGFFRLAGTPNGDRAGYLTPQGFKNMHPVGYTMSRIDDSWGGYHCGAGMPGGTANLNALFWVGGETAVNLHPGGPYSNSMAFAGAGQIQVGFVQMGDETFAAAWSRTPISMRILPSQGYQHVVANSTDGVQHGGQGANFFNHHHALLWKTSFLAPVDLHPQEFMISAVTANSGNTQAGYAYQIDNKYRAMLWNGTAESHVNLHPAGFDTSVVHGMRGDVQVGSGTVLLNGGGERTQAIAWHGSAGSWIDLHSRLPAEFQGWHSVATDVDNNGNIVGYVASPSWGMKRPVIWLRSDGI